MKQSDIQVTLIDHMGSDLSVVNAARVSFHKESTYDWYDIDGRGPVSSPSPCGTYFNIPKIKEADVKLINYLAKHKHFSPFNHTFVSMRIKAPIFVARQLVKHKFMPWNEVSRRYVDDEPEFYFPDVWRAKAENVKQGSSLVAAEYMQKEQWDGTESLNPYCSTEDLVYRDVRSLVGMYQDMINNGVCAEQARMILPQNMMTEWWWSGSLGAWCDMLILRLDKHTQYETRIVAEKVYGLIEPLFPVSVKARMEAAGVSRN